MTEIRSGEVRGSDRNSTLRRPTKEFKFAWDYYMVGGTLYVCSFGDGLLFIMFTLCFLNYSYLPTTTTCISDVISYNEGYEAQRKEY